MTFLVLTAALLTLVSIGYSMGRARAVRSAAAAGARLNSLPSYYGHYVALWCGLPALCIIAAWLMLEPSMIRALVVAGLPEAARDLDPARLDLLLNDIRNVARGAMSAGSAGEEVKAAAERVVVAGAARLGAESLARLAHEDHRFREHQAHGLQQVLSLLLGVSLEVEALYARHRHIDGELDRVVGPGHLLGALHLLRELRHAPAQLVRIAEEAAEGVFRRHALNSR